MDRVLDLLGEVPLDDLPADDVRAGSPRAGLRTLTTVGEVEVGVWEMTPGTAVDVEVDEVFVVLAGEATVGFEDGEEIELRPGVAVRLRAGERTTWTVRSTLRKLYVA
ncbi:cupin domain-containing protein [Nocardioides fonticola]|uniref:Cupin domain-containing protein n=1 Tax=Nocardioides fonticola TaxID=450363 RepID=A0ABP7X8Q4_9ACTN